MKLWTIQCVAVFLVSLLLSGCGGDCSTLWEDVDQLKAENIDLSLKVQRLEAENTQLAGQVDTLAGMEKDVRLEALDVLGTIHIGKRSGVYDLNDDGTKETLVVYVEPRDSAQDTVKATGSVEVQLWNLDASANQAKLADWILEPHQLQELWGGNIFTSYYRLTFDISDILSTRPKELTAKVTFTDYLSGKVLSDQIVITP